jgi:hypothetical protein
MAPDKLKSLLPININAWLFPSSIKLLRKALLYRESGSSWPKICQISKIYSL